MATQERIDAIRGYMGQHEAECTAAGEARDRRLKLKSLAASLMDDEGIDILQKQADQADDAARQFHLCATRMRALLGLAENGENV